MAETEPAVGRQGREFQVLFCGHAGSAAEEFSSLLIPTIRQVLPDNVALRIAEVESPLALLGTIKRRAHDLVILMFNPWIKTAEFAHIRRTFLENGPHRDAALASAQALPEGCDYLREVRTRTTKPILVIQNGFLIAESGQLELLEAGADLVLSMPYDVRSVAPTLARILQDCGIEPRAGDGSDDRPTRFTAVVSINEPAMEELVTTFALACGFLPPATDWITLASHHARSVLEHPLTGQADLVVALVNNLWFPDAPASVSLAERHLGFLGALRRQTPGAIVALNGLWDTQDDLKAAQTAGADFAVTLPFDYKTLATCFHHAEQQWTGKARSAISPVPATVVLRSKLTVLIAGFSGKKWPDIIAAIIESRWGADCDVHVIQESKPTGLLARADTEPVDLFMVHFPDNPSRPESELITLECLIAKLRARFGRPVIVSGRKLAGTDSRWDGFSPASLLRALDSVLKPPRLTATFSGNPRWRRLSRSPRIVMLDDEPAVLEVLAAVAGQIFPGATILTFSDAERAYEELLREDPDLFTTDFCHLPPDGDELLRRLTARGAKYPVFVISSVVGRIEDVRPGSVGPDLNVTFLAKPFSVDELFWHLLKQVGLRADPGSRARGVGATSDD